MPELAHGKEQEPRDKNDDGTPGPDKADDVLAFAY
jgi:hypothetical protein